MDAESGFDGGAQKFFDLASSVRVGQFRAKEPIGREGLVGEGLVEEKPVMVFHDETMQTGHFGDETVGRDTFRFGGWIAVQEEDA